MHTQAILQANYWECLPCVFGRVPMPVRGKYMGMPHKWMAKCAALSLRAECHRGPLKSSGRKCHINRNSLQWRALGKWMKKKKKDQTKHKCVVKAKNLVSHAGMNDEILNFECNLHIIHTFCGSVHVHTDPNWQHSQKTPTNQMWEMLCPFCASSPLNITERL